MKNINEKMAGLSELIELTEYLSVERTEDSLSHVLSNGEVIQWGGEYIPVIKKEDFNKVFYRHWKVYIDKNKYSDKQTYIEITIKYLNRLLENIEDSHKTIKDTESLKSDLNHTHYLRCKDYILFLEKYKVGKSDSLYDYLTTHKVIYTTIEVFNFVMENKHLPKGVNKIQCLTSQANVLYIFKVLAKFEIPEINECFQSDTGNPFQKGSIPSTNRITEIEFVSTFFQE
ncbi:MAG: hypothetical protein WCS03_08110 [Bacteroidota bacterium]